MPENTNVSETLSQLGFDEMHYWIRVDTEKFDLDKFRAAFGGDKNREQFVSVVAPENPKTGEYHLIFNALIGKKEHRLKLDYYKGPKNHESDEHPPYAEQFVEWLGQFFKYDTAQSHIHAEFEYPVELKRCRFPLPLKTNVRGDAEDAIDGLSFKLAATPEGVSRIRLSQGKSHLYVEVIANRRITFKDHTPYADVRPLWSVLDSLVEARKT